MIIPDGPQRGVLSIRGLADTIRLPGIGLLVGIGAISVLAFAALEGTFSLYLKERLGWTPEGAAFGFAMLGLISAFVQGGLIRRLVPRFGEPRLILVGLATVSVGFAALAVLQSWPAVFGAICAVGVGQGLVSPSVAGLLSRITPASEQGAVFGTYTSAQTLSRMVNYAVANLVLERWGSAGPYWEACAIAALGLALATRVIRAPIPARPLPSEQPDEHRDRDSHRSVPDRDSPDGSTPLPPRRAVESRSRPPRSARRDLRS